MPMSAVPPKADIPVRDWHVRSLPKGDVAVLIRLQVAVGPFEKLGFLWG